MDRIKERLFRDARWFVLAMAASAFLIVVSGMLVGSLREPTVTAGPATGAQTQTENPSQAFDPERQGRVFAESGGLTVSLEKTEPCEDCVGGTAFTFAVTDKRSSTARSFTIRNDTAQVDEVVIVNPSRALVMGSLTGTTRGVNVVDLERREVIDFFYSHFPSVSKDRRFVAYVKFTPRVQSGAPQGHVYLVYDLTASPTQNRLAAGQQGAEPLDDHVNVGIPVYPLENVGRAMSDAGPNEEAPPHVLASEGFSWLPGNTLAFVDRWKKANYLVMVDLSAGVRPARRTVRPLDTAAIGNRGACTESIDAPENLISVTEISVPAEESGVVRLRFAPRGPCLRQTTLDMPVR